MKVYLATDHAGFHLKEIVKAYLLGANYDVKDEGAMKFDKNDDYPDFISVAAAKISENPFDRAIIFGGSGMAEAIVANKYPHVRATVFYGSKEAIGEIDATGKVSNDPYTIVRLMRQHNDANILSLAARFLADEEAIDAITVFLTTPFSEEERHKRRIEKIAMIEKDLHE